MFPDDADLARGAVEALVSLARDGTETEQCATRNANVQVDMGGGGRVGL